MASKFNLDEVKTNYIAEEFGVRKETVESINTIFNKLYSELKRQYLAHIIRSMESYIRKIANNPMFQINCFPLPPESPNFNVGCAQYFPKRYFTIFYHPAMDDKQLRVCLAHELGHLFLLEMMNIASENIVTFEDNIEPLSSIFGILTILDKNDFYKEAAALLNHESWQDVIRSFSHLNNRVNI
jgi:hypothetical protein